MNEDGAFIRAIVDNPGDDTPRLVYADWLDDRDDPRGPYLRAERDAVESGDIARLRELAAGLDPVWVARVSLPPVGVCLEEAEISGCGPRMTAADITDAEARLGITLSPDYRAFLLNYNGGLIRRVWGEVGSETFYSDNGLRLLPVVAGSQDDSNTLVQRTSRYRNWINDPASYEGATRDARVAGMFSRYIPIGYYEGSDGEVLLGVRESDIGRIYRSHDIYLLSDHHLGVGAPQRAAPSVAAFLADFLWPAPPPLVRRARPPSHSEFDDLPF